MRIIAPIGLLALAVTTAAQPAPLKRGPDMDRLEVFLGTWEGELTRHMPDGRDLELTPRVTFAWDVGDAWLRGRDRTRLADDTVIENITWITWHKGKGIYTGAWQDNVFPQMVPFQARWADGGALVLETTDFAIGGRAHHVSLTYTFDGRNTYRTEMRQSWDDGDPVLVAEGVFRRVEEE